MSRFLISLFLIGTLTAAATAYNLRGDDMPEIKFRLGENIHETAKQSGAPKYMTRNIAGLISYKLLDLPPDIPAIYDVADYRIKSIPLFAFTMYADKDSNNNLAVETANLMFSTNEINSHESGMAFVERLITQFQDGKWKRFIDELCPAVTGRSSFLDETGEPGQICSLDPQYRLSMEDWIQMVAMTQRYEWLGDGVLATLTVRFSNDIRGLTYAIDLDFQNFAIMNRRFDELTRQKLAEGDAAGRNSTAKQAKELIEAKARIRTLEANALKRGDTVVPR